MKLIIVVIICLISLTQCTEKQKETDVTQEEKTEWKKVESFKKTDKEKEDSVLAKWQKKMNESKVGE